jgi:hypothetical protein
MKGSLLGHAALGVRVKGGSECFTGVKTPVKTLKLAIFFNFFNFDSKFGFKSIIFVRMALNFESTSTKIRVGFCLLGSP